MECCNRTVQVGHRCAGCPHEETSTHMVAAPAPEIPETPQPTITAEFIALVVKERDALRKRVTDLLEANNRLVEERRASENWQAAFERSQDDLAMVTAERDAYRQEARDYQKNAEEVIAATQSQPAAKAGDAEPVCYLVEHKATGWTETPLYAAPPSPQPDMGSGANDRDPGAICICGDEDCGLWLYHGFSTLSPPASQSVEKMTEALEKIADECEGTAPDGNIVGIASKCHRIAKQALATPSGRAQGEASG